MQGSRQEGTLLKGVVHEGRDREEDSDGVGTDHPVAPIGGLKNV